MAATRTDTIDQHREMLLPLKWERRAEVTNWMISGEQQNVAVCTDNNYGNIGIFSQKSFNPARETSLQLVINVNSPVLANARIGLVSCAYPKKRNKDYRVHSAYGFFFRPGNCFLGSAKTPYNLGLSLLKEMTINGDQVRVADQRTQSGSGGDVKLRVDIRRNEARFECPQLWGSDVVIQHISCSKKLRFAVCSPAGFAFGLHEVLQCALKKEIPKGLHVRLQDPDQMSLRARRRCREIVDEIRRMSPEHGERYNLLVAGAIGSGKSSLINTVFSAFSSFKTRPKQIILTSRNGYDHTTREVYSYQLPGTNVHVIDSVGLAVSTGSGLNYTGHLLDDLFRGNIRSGFDIRTLKATNLAGASANAATDEGFEYKASEEVSWGKGTTFFDGADGYKAFLELDERNHGAFVTRAATQYGDKCYTQFKQIVEFGSQHDNFPLVGVVTKLDNGMPDFTIPKLFTDPTLCQKFSLVRKEMMLPSCFRIRPYADEDQHKQDALINLLAVDLLHKMMGEAVEYKERLRERYYEQQAAPQA